MRSIPYSYEDVPTIFDFATSNARLRGLLGPFRCLSGDTEILTPCGWVRLDAYAGQPVMQWTPDDGPSGGVGCFIKPSDYIVQACPALIEFDCGFGLKMRVTAEHRMPHYNWAGRFQVREAAEIAAHPSRRTIPTTFRTCVATGLDMSEDMIRFAVMMHADGHYPRQGRQAIITVRKERKKERIRLLLTRLDIRWAEVASPSRPTETRFVFRPPYRGKRYDGAWWSANQDQLAVVLDEMPHWDGLFDGDVSIFSSAHKIDADFIQYAAHANGLRASLSVVERADKPEWAPQYRLCVRMGDNHKNRACVREGTVIRHVPTEDGKVYCLTVPSGFFVARYANTVFITGNSGKSSGSVNEITSRGVEQLPGPDGVARTRWIVVRNTFAQLEDSTIRTVHMWYPPEQFGHYWATDHNYTIQALAGVGHKSRPDIKPGYPTEIEVWFRALDRPDHVRNLLSVEVTGGWVNEAREVPWSIVEALTGRIGQYPPKMMGGPTWDGLWLDTNPPDTDSAWYRFFEEMKHDPNEVAIFRQPSGLSPQAENLTNLPSRDYYKRLAYGKAPEWVKVYIEGQYGYVAEGMPIYPEFKDSVHVRSDVEVDDAIRVVRSYDFGLTPACAFSQLLPDGRWHTFAEMVSKNMSIDEFSDDVLEFCNKAFRGHNWQFEDWGDPAGAQRAQTDKRTCFEIMRAKGIMIEPSIQNVQMRWESVRKPLRTLVMGEPQFILHPRCRSLRKGFLGAYHRRRLKVSGAERYSDQAEKGPTSHVHDALQYGMVQYFAPALTGEPDADDYPEVNDYAAQATRSAVTGY